MLLKHQSLGIYVLTFVTMLLYLPDFGHAFECYQCNSTNSDECLEIFDPELNSLTPTPCIVVDTKYCIKTTGAWGGVVGTQRFCSSRDMGNQCQFFGFDDHDRIYRGCTFTCDDERCNGSNKLSQSLIFVLLPVISFIKHVLSF